MIKFRTYSGSVYELDQDNKRIRRLSGVKDPTPRQGADGQWKTYVHLKTEPEPGNDLYICWSVGDGEGGSDRCTVTSRIEEILPN